MESIDLFATKGIEYIFILGFLGILVFFWKAINPERKSNIAMAANKALGVNWFPVDSSRYYHQGHTWVQPLGNNEALVGLDLLACKMLGREKEIEIISQAKTVSQGTVAMEIKVGGLVIPVLSPVGGKIIARNDDDGCPEAKKLENVEWLFKVKTENLKANLTNLLTGKMAQLWRADTEAMLNSKINPELGLVLQDGGDIEEGFVLHLTDEARDDIIKHVFLID